MSEPIEAKGSFYEVGHEIGRQTSDEIAFVYDSIVPDLLKDAFDGDLERFHRMIAAYRKAAEETFAPSMELASGMAKGCGRSLADMLAIVFCEELSSGPPTERCSTLCVWTEDGWMIGHQEDYWPVFYGRMLIYDLEITGYPRTVSMNYAGNLPHLAGSLNAAGVAITNNSLWVPVRPGRSKQVNHFEAALQDDPTNAVQKLVRGPVALTDHFFVAGKDEVLTSVEVTSPLYVIDGYLDLACIHVRPSYPHDKTATHSNTVERLRLLKPDPAPPGAHMRKHRLEAIARERELASIDGLENALTEKDGILCRDAVHNWTLQKNSVTLGTALIVPRLGEARFIRYRADGPPQVNNFCL